MAHPSKGPRGNKEARKPKQPHPVNAPGLPAGLVPASPVPRGPLAAAETGMSLFAVDADTLPTSFGVFRPVGHVMVGLPTQAQADSLVSALQGAGWAGSAVQQFTPRESVADMEALVERAGPMAGFGYEINLLRRYLALAREGYRWLLVKVSGTEQAALAAELARDRGATLAVHYRMLTEEELI